MSKVIPPTTMKTLVGKKVEFTNTKEVLTEDHLNALYWHCLNTNGNGVLPKLGEKQKRQLMAYATKKAESYGSGHDMRWSIMRDVTRALFDLSNFGVTKVHLTLEGDIYHLYNSEKCIVPLATFTELSDLDQYCRENNYKYNATKILQ